MPETPKYDYSIDRIIRTVRDVFQYDLTIKELRKVIRAELQDNWRRGYLHGVKRGTQKGIRLCCRLEREADVAATKGDEDGELNSL